MIGPRRHHRGFTLLELLVAMSIFALIGVVSAALLNRILDARSLSEERAERLGGVQRAVLRLERDLLQANGRSIRDAYGDSRPALLLENGGRVEFSHHGWRNPLELDRSEVQRVAWSLNEEGDLVRHYWSVLDRAQDSQSRTQTVLAAVEDLEFVLLDMEGGSWRNWPPDQATPALPGEDGENEPLPGALRVSLTLAPFGRIERLIPLARMPVIEEDVGGPGDDSLPEDQEEGEGEGDAAAPGEEALEAEDEERARQDEDTALEEGTHG